MEEMKHQKYETWERRRLSCISAFYIKFRAFRVFRGSKISSLCPAVTL